MASGNNIEVARAFVTIVPSMEGSQKTIATEMGAAVEPAAKEAGEKGGKTLGESLGKGLKTTAAVIGGALTAATAAAVGTGKAFLNAANSTAQLGDEIQKNSQKMNLSYSGYQELDYILQRNGSSISSMSAAMLTLTKKAEGGSDAFKTLGISQADLAKMSPEETLNATLKALQGVDDEAKRTTLASQLLGSKAAKELGPTLRMTADEMDAMRQQAHDLGGVMSDDAVEAAAKYQDELLNMNTALTGVKNNMMSQFLPGISQVMNGLSSVFSGDQGGVANITAGLQSVVQNITALAPTFFSLASNIVNSLLSGFAPMVPQLVSSLFGFIQTGLLTLAELTPQLTPVISEGLKGVSAALMTCLPVLISGLLDMTKELVTWLASGDNVKVFVDGVLQLISTIASGLADALPILIPAIVNIIGQIAQSLTDEKNVRMIVNAALQIVGAVVVALVKALPEIGGVIVKLGTNVLGLLKELGGSIVSKIGPWFSSVLSNIGTFVSDIFRKLGELPGKALEAGKNLIQGLVKGITQAGKAAIDAVKTLGGNLISGLKNKLGIHSPSKVFEELGLFTGEGYLNGIRSSFADVNEYMTDNMSGMTANMSATVTASVVDGGALSGTAGGSYHGGDVTINVYGAEGQDVGALAEIIAVKLQDMTNRRAAVYA